MPPHRTLFGLYSNNCPECGQNRGLKPDEHVCDPKQKAAHQSSLFAVRLKGAERHMEAYLGTNEGQFLMWLVQQKRI